MYIADYYTLMTTSFSVNNCVSSNCLHVMQEPGEEEVTFCSMNCMNQFMHAEHLLHSHEEDMSSTSASMSTIIMDDFDDNQDENEGDHMKDSSMMGKLNEHIKMEIGSPTRGLGATEALSISTSSPAPSASASATTATTQPGTPTTPTPCASGWLSPSTSPAHSHSMTSPVLHVRASGPTSPVRSPHPMLSPPLRGKGEERAGKRHRRSSSTASQEGYIFKV